MSRPKKNVTVTDKAAKRAAKREAQAKKDREAHFEATVGPWIEVLCTTAEAMDTTLACVVRIASTMKYGRTVDIVAHDLGVSLSEVRKLRLAWLAENMPDESYLEEILSKEEASTVTDNPA